MAMVWLRQHLRAYAYGPCVILTGVHMPLCVAVAVCGCVAVCVIT